MKQAWVRMVCAAALILGNGAARGSSASQETHSKGNIMVTIETSMGTVEIELFEKEAPKTVENFLAYVEDGFFDGTVFHRVIPDFMIQGGGLTPDLRQKRGRAPIRNEADNGLKNERGTLAMARTAEVNSATTQFFINLDHNAFLDHGVRDFGYAVFGRVSSGMDVVDRIAAVATRTQGGHQNVPVEPVEIRSARRVPAE